MRRLSVSGFLAAGIVFIACNFLTGCSTSKPARSQSEPDPLELTSFWRPHLLYILSSPYKRLYVEVDAVEGCVPSDAVLNKLHDFLVIHCDKPDGINIVRGDVIPSATARGMPLRALARKFINGPPDLATSAPPAYLYVLFYDPALCDKPAATNASQLTASTASAREPTPQRPHVDFLPYPPVMYINPRYGPARVQADLLIHEAGHELGLAGRTNDASDYHCLDENCLMNWTLRYHIGRRLLGKDPIKQHHLCERCLAQLAESAKQPPPANIRFVGPVLVRSETGYHVLSLPDRVKIIAGNLTEQDPKDFAAAVHAENAPSENGDVRIDWLVKDEVLHQPATLVDSFNRAKADPLEPVRTAAPRVFAQFCASQHQYTNAIAICREAITSNPKDDWSYNLLAWIKATCPDSSLRDGKEAVSAATKACELTQWKEFNWIDTLAAACAESGDFQRAIQFQEQALHTGNPPDSDRKEMQDRLALYQQSQPYREKR
jgi:tetratricopeptide (TPR) repeat protein